MDGGSSPSLARAESRAFYSVTAIFLRPSSPSQPTKKRDDPQTNYRRLPTSPPAPARSFPLSQNVASLSILLLLAVLLQLLLSTAAVLCLYHGTRGRQCAQGAMLLSFPVGDTYVINR